MYYHLDSPSPSPSPSYLSCHLHSIFSVLVGGNRLYETKVHSMETKHANFDHKSGQKPSLKELKDRIIHYCRWCDQALSGRSDKRFCSIHCKNAWHHWTLQNGRKLPIIRTIIANSRIMQALLDEGKEKVRMQELLRRGFAPEFNTHQWVSENGTTYNFCFQLGWCILKEEPDMVHIIEKPNAGR